MTPSNAVRNRSTRRAALAGVVALGLIALPACGGDDDTDDTVVTVAPGGVATTMAPTDTTMPTGTASPGTSDGSTMTTTPTSMVDSTTAP